MARMNRYEESVIGVAARLAMSVSGATDPLSDSEVSRYVGWLRWRIAEGWEPSVRGELRGYDESVRAMAREALRMYVTIEEPRP